MAIQKLKVEYFGTNVGKIYLSDCTKRLALGGSKEGDYLGGQDRFIVWGEVVVLEVTDDVMFSVAQGILKYFSTAASSSQFTTNGAPLVLTGPGAYTSADEVPRRDFANTGLFDDAYITTVLANDHYAPSGATGSGCTGWYVGNSL
jgi:hypothetical protein